MCGSVTYPQVRKKGEEREGGGGVVFDFFFFYSGFLLKIVGLFLLLVK